MNRIDLLKKILPGFIPLFVFIAADAIWGTRIGLIVALVFGVAEMAFIYIKEKRFDKFVLIDTALLLALGGISIAFDNDIFFKVKPAIIEAILCVILAVSAYTRLDIVGSMSQRYIKGVEINNELKKQFSRTLKTMFWIFSAHTALVLYSAFYMSNQAWAFISGGLFYILFAVYFLIEFFHQKRKAKQQSLFPADDEEWLPIVDTTGKVTGKALRSVCHNGQKLLHPVVHLHVINHAGHVFLQKRPVNKLIQPGKWDTAVGGHIAFGEDVKTALKREAFEEIGLENFSARPLGSYVFESNVEREMIYSFITHDFRGINIHSNEVAEGRFWSKKRIESNIGNGTFTPNFEHEYKLLVQPFLLNHK